MNSETTARLDRGKVYAVYCDGIGCNRLDEGRLQNSRGWDFAPRSCSEGSIGGATMGIR
jgi:hypothetical protein